MNCRCASGIELEPQDIRSQIPSQLDIAPVELVEGYYQQLETLLLEIGYLLPHTAAHRMEKIRRLYNRSQLSPNEVALLRGILRQVNWAIKSVENE
jgi:tRNA/rRNA methyltransferase